MLRLALCDDNSVQLDMILELVNSYFETNKYPAHIVSFSSGEELLNDIEKNGFYDAYILDMIMPGIKGIDLGMELRKRGDKGRIIYLTATPDYAVASYKVGAFFYLLKPFGKDSIYEVLSKVCKEYDREQAASFTVKTRNGNRLVETVNILYVDILNRSLCYHMKDGTEIAGLTLRVPFQEAVKTLMEVGFFTFCGSSTVVNMKNIDIMDKEKVIFKGGEDFYPPKTAYASFKESVNNFFN